MNARPSLVILVIASSCAAQPLLPPAFAPLPRPAPAAAASSATNAETIYGPRLAALAPGDSAAYFELAELIAAEAVDHADLMLAKRLFTLVYEFDRTKGGAGLAPSACVALASLPPLAKDRDWLLSIAGLIDPRYGQTAQALEDDAVVPPATAYQAAAALGMVRSGEGVAARNLLADVEVQQVLRRYERLLFANGSLGALNTLKSEAERWPCPVCSGARFMKTSGSSEARKCSACDALPGWKLKPSDVESQLSLESRLLDGIQSSWAAQILSDDEAPLRDFDPASVPAALNVDVRRTLYRGGEWIDPAAADPSPVRDTLPPRIPK